MNDRVTMTAPTLQTQQRRRIQDRDVVLLLWDVSACKQRRLQVDLM